MVDEMDFENRIVSPEYEPNDLDTEVSLRPKTLDEYVGQEKIKKNLNLIKSEFNDMLSEQNIIYSSLWMQWWYQ